jgi:uncharacterized membrane protein YhaH (DUF805 family)
MNFGQAIAAGFSNYVTFAGRANRSEYWYWALFVALFQIPAAIIDTVIGVNVMTSVFGLATFLPSLAVAVRRLHDLDRTGWWILLSLIPVVGWIILIIWDCTKGTEGPNRFGPDRLAALGAQLTPRPAA